MHTGRPRHVRRELELRLRRDGIALALGLHRTEQPPRIRSCTDVHVHAVSNIGGIRATASSYVLLRVLHLESSFSPARIAAHPLRSYNLLSDACHQCGFRTKQGPDARLSGDQSTAAHQQHPASPPCRCTGRLCSCRSSPGRRTRRTRGPSRRRAPPDAGPARCRRRCLRCRSPFKPHIDGLK